MVLKANDNMITAMPTSPPASSSISRLKGIGSGKQGWVHRLVGAFSITPEIRCLSAAAGGLNCHSVLEKPQGHAISTAL